MITVATATYNRAGTLPRVFESLKNQEYQNFEWLVIDDGSTDNTKDVVDSFEHIGHSFPITYVYQKKQGKHIAINRAVELAKGDMFITIDSDDAFKPNAFSFMHKMWENVPEEDKKELKGISVRRCKPNALNKIIGARLPVGKNGYIKSDDEEVRFKHKVRSGFGGMTRTEIMRMFPNPEIKGINYFPESIIWGRMGREYKTLYFDEPLEILYSDGSLRVTESLCYKERWYLRKYIFEEIITNGYFKYSPCYFIKQAIALWRDGFLNGFSAKEIFSVPKTRCGKVVAAIGYPFGKLLYEGLNRVIDKELQ